MSESKNRASNGNVMNVVVVEIRERHCNVVFYDSNNGVTFLPFLVTHYHIGLIIRNMHP